MSGNLCRCGAYAGITEAVLDAAETGRWEAIATSTDDEQRITA